MKKYRARIVDGVVDQVSVVGEILPGQVEIADGAGIGWAYTDGVFTPPVKDDPEPDFDEPNEIDDLYDVLEAMLPRFNREDVKTKREARRAKFRAQRAQWEARRTVAIRRP